VLNASALARIGEYVGDEMKFATVEQATEYVRQVSLSFGPHSDAQWRKLAVDVLHQDADGKWKFCYDPALGIALHAMTPEAVQQAETMLWAAYDAIACPSLLIRGEESDLLSRETAQAMTQRGPKATVVEIPGVGHAPTFVHATQIAIVKNFLLA
jgi:pimeloyl-ACP methyl ester carboxylesterase